MKKNIYINDKEYSTKYKTFNSLLKEFTFLRDDIITFDGAKYHYDEIKCFKFDVIVITNIETNEKGYYKHTYNKDYYCTSKYTKMTKKAFNEHINENKFDI